LTVKVSLVSETRLHTEYDLYLPSLTAISMSTCDYWSKSFCCRYRGSC